MQNNKTTRIEYIDLAKGFCIFLVVVFHITAGLKVELPFNDYLVLFRMPLYFFLSGCFFKSYNGFMDFLKRKTNKLLIPFFFSYLFFSFLVPSLIFHLFHVDWGTLPLSRLPLAWFYVEYPFIAIWFLLCLFEMNILFYFTHWLAEKTSHKILVLIVASVIMATISYLLVVNEVEMPRMKHKALQAQPFFMAGYLTFRKSQILKPNKYDKYLPLLILGCFGLLALFRHSYGWMGYFSVYAAGLAGTYGVILLAKYIKWLPMFSYFGRYSIMILISHGLVLTAYIKLCAHFNLSTMMTCMITIVCTWLSYYLIIPFMRRFMPHVTAQKDVFR